VELEISLESLKTSTIQICSYVDSDYASQVNERLMRKVKIGSRINVDEIFEGKD
jgi:hypothetical protein